MLTLTNGMTIRKLERGKGPKRWNESGWCSLDFRKRDALFLGRSKLRILYIVEKERDNLRGSKRLGGGPKTSEYWPV